MGCLDTGVIVAYVAGDIASDERTLVDAHIDGCRDCARLLADAAVDAYRGAADTRRSEPGVTIQGVASAEDATTPTTIGRYEVRRVLGRGGMGTVFEAYDPELQREVAVKVLRRAATRQEAHARLLREAQAMARLSHPNVITVNDVGTDSGRVFIAMELLHGNDLRAWFRQPRKWRDVAEVMMQAAEGLVAAHEAELLHRDFKPDNVFVSNDGRVRVMDFGLARPLHGAFSEDTPAPSASSSDWSGRLTHTGTVVGTPAYMAAEQWEGEELDARTDQFAFAAVFWEGVYGARPFCGPSPKALHAAVREGTLSPRAEANVPRWLFRILERALRPNREERFSSLPSMLGALQRGMDRGRRIAMGFAGAGAVLVVSVGALVSIGPEPGPACDDGAQRFAEIWTDARAAAVREAFVATELPYAEATAAKVAARISEFGVSWAAAYETACTTPATSDAALACLRSRRLEVEALVDRLARGGSSTVESAVAQVNALAPPETCAETARKLNPAAQALEDELVGLAGGDDPEVVAASSLEVSDRAMLLGADRVAALALNRRARSLEALGRYKEAAEAAREAAQRAEAADDDAAAADAWISVAHLRGVELGEFEEGLQAIRFAEANVERMGNPPRARANLENTRADLLVVAGRFDEALAAQEVGERFAEAVVGDPLLTARSHRVRGAVQTARGRYEDALLGHEAARAILLSELGESHPNHVAELANEANVLKYLGRLGEAQEKNQRAVDLAQELQQPAFLAQLQANLAMLYEKQGDNEAALQRSADAVATLRAAAGEEHPSFPLLLSNLGLAYNHVGKHAEALHVGREALELRIARFGADHPSVGHDHVGIGNALRGLGRLEEAATAFEQGVALFEKSEGDPYELAAARYQLAAALDELQPGSKRVRTLLEAALAGIADDPQPDSQVLREAIRRELK